MEDKNQNKQKQKKGTNGNEETSQDKGGRTDIDGRMFILQKAIRLKRSA